MIKYPFLLVVVVSITLFANNAEAQVKDSFNVSTNQTNISSNVNIDLEVASEPKAYVLDDNGDKIYFLVNPKIEITSEMSAQPIRSDKDGVIQDPALRPE